MSTKLKKSRFTIERRIFQDSTFLRGWSRSQQNKWSDWCPYHTVESIINLNRCAERCKKLEDLGSIKQEFRFINNYPAVDNQLRFNLLNEEDKE